MSIKSVHTKKSNAPLRYVLITVARNEVQLIEGTLRSVVNQTHRPERWFIVSDDSTDGTDEIVQSYQRENPWINFIRMASQKERSFKGKAFGFNEAFRRTKAIGCEIIGNLDADVTMDPDFFEYLISRFREIPDLGVAGAAFIEDEVLTYQHGFAHLKHVSGQCQLFRRQCLEEIGGYMPISRGGIDWMAVTTARMKGWRTQTFPEISFYHHRKMGSEAAGPLMARFRHGQKDYYLGGHPLWQISRVLFQMRVRPYVLGGTMLGLGYVWAFLRGFRIEAPRELVRFHRKEQMSRLREALFSRGLDHSRRAK